MNSERRASVIARGLNRNQVIVFSLVLSSFLYFIVHMCECHMY